MPSDPIPHSPAAQVADLDRRRAARAELRRLLERAEDLGVLSWDEHVEIVGPLVDGLPGLLDDLDRHEREAAAEAERWAALERERDEARAAGAAEGVLRDRADRYERGEHAAEEER